MSQPVLIMAAAGGSQGSTGRVIADRRYVPITNEQWTAAVNEQIT